MVEKFTIHGVLSVLLLSYAVSVNAIPINAHGGSHVTWNSIPFSFDGRYQQIYSSGFFSAGFITSLSFAPADSAIFSSDITIKLSNTTVDIGGLSSNLDENIASHQKTVMNEIAFTQSVTGGSPNDFSFVLDFSSSHFLYNPKHGNLLVDITLSNTSYTSDIFRMSRSDGNGLLSRAWDNTGHGEGSDSLGLRTNIGFVAVPEPSILALMSVGLIGLIGFARCKS